jgi:hypothetical protein
MWKILVAFIIFAVIALAAVFNMGDKANMQGEAGGHTETEAKAPAAEPAAAPTEAPAAAAAPATAEGDKK